MPSIWTHDWCVFYIPDRILLSRPFPSFLWAFLGTEPAQACLGPLRKKFLCQNVPKEIYSLSRNIITKYPVVLELFKNFWGGVYPRYV